MLDPQARNLLDLIDARNLPALNALPPAEARKAYRDGRAALQPPAPEVASSRDFEVPGPGGSLTVREYRPQGGTPDQTLGALVYLHGGGWVIGDIDTHDTLCRLLSNQSGCAVYSVDYRLAPESPFPGPANDALAATRWVFDNAESLSIDPLRIGIGGDSAGGNLSAVACLAMRDSGGPRPAFQLLIYPGTDMHPSHASHKENGEGYMLTSASIEYFASHYLKASEYDDWRASPLLAGSHADLPPALVITAGFDPLRDEGLAYADRLSEAGNSVQYVSFSRMIHGFLTMSGVLDEAKTAITLCAAVMRERLGSSIRCSTTTDGP